jgi:hypothetical protein
MTRLSIFLGAIFYVALAIIFIVPIFDRRRAMRLQADETEQESRHREAA